MRKIEIPLKRNFFTQVVDMKEALKELESGSKQIIPLGTIDFGQNGKDIDLARTNGGIIIWSAICLEEKLELLITNYLFLTEPETTNQKGKQFFTNRIIKTNHFSFSAKKNLVIEIVHKESLLTGRHKNELDKSMKDAMDFRNAFAHGDIQFEADKGCVLRYWSGDSRSAILTDDYWSKVESCFTKAHSLLDNICANLEAK